MAFDRATLIGSLIDVVSLSYDSKCQGEDKLEDQGNLGLGSPSSHKYLAFFGLKRIDSYGSSP